MQSSTTTDFTVKPLQDISIEQLKHKQWIVQSVQPCLSLDSPTEPSLSSSSSSLFSSNHSSPLYNVIIEDATNPNSTLILRADQLSLIKNEQSHRRRIEFRLLQSYISECRKLEIEPFDLLVQNFSSCIKLGKEMTELNFSHQSLNTLSILAVLNGICKDKDCLLSRIDLSANQFDSIEMSYALSNVLLCNKSLRELDLSHNKLEKKAVEKIAYGLASNHTLSQLNLADTEIGSEGCSIILNSILQNEHNMIVRLNLQYNECKEMQIEQLLCIAQQCKHFCFADLYPASKELEGQKEEDHSAWLNFDGWVAYEKLRDQLATNLEWIKQHSLQSVNHKFDIKEYILYHLETVKSQLIEKSGMSYEEWKKNKVRKKEWIQLATEQSQRIAKESLVTSSTSVIKEEKEQNDWIVVEEEEEKIASQPLKKPVTITCKICMEEKLPSEIYIMDECFDRFCRTCISTYVDIKVKNYEISSIKCPECSHSLTEQEVKLILRMNGEKAMVNKYEEASLKQALSSMKNLIWCPNPTCGNAMVFEEANSPQQEQQQQQEQDAFGVVVSQEEVPQLFSTNEVSSQPSKPMLQQSTTLYQYSPSHHIAPSESISLNINLPISPVVAIPTNNDDPDDFFTTIALAGTAIPPKQKSKSFEDVSMMHLQSSNSSSEESSTTLVSSHSMSQLNRLEDIKPKSLATYTTIECSECKWKICTQCRQKAHPNQTCEEAKHNIENSDDLEMSNWMAQHKAKECPFCSMRIEKSIGCNTMTCANCKNKFCWSCNTKFEANSNEELQKKIREHFSSGKCYKYNFFEFINPF